MKRFIAMIHLKLVRSTATGTKVLYKSAFKEEEIGFEKIGSTLTAIYRDGLQKEIERFYRQ